MNNNVYAGLFRCQLETACTGSLSTLVDRSCKGDETLEIDSVCEGHFVEDENELVLLQVGWDGFGKKCDIFETTWSWRT